MGSKYVTKWTRQANQIGKAIENPIGNSELERDRYVEDMYVLIDYEGVTDHLITNKYHCAMVRSLSQYNEKIQKTTLQMVLNMAKSNKTIKDRLRNDKQFMQILIDEIIKIIYSKMPQNYQYLNEIILNVLLEYFKNSIQPYITQDLENQLIEAITSSILPPSSQKTGHYQISWSYIYSLLVVLNSVNNKEGQETVERFIVSIMKYLVMRWKYFSNYQKLGIVICKFLLKFLDKSESDDLFCSIIESNLEEVLIKLLFETHLEMTTEYYLNGLKLFWRLLYYKPLSSIIEPSLSMRQNCWSTTELSNHFCNKQKLHIKQMITRYLPMICSSLLEKIKRYNNQEIMIFGFKIFHTSLCVIKDLDAIINESNQHYWFQWLVECLSIEVNRLSINEPDPSISECIQWTSITLLELLTLNPALIYDKNRNRVNRNNNHNINTENSSSHIIFRPRINTEGELNDTAIELTTKIIQIMYSSRPVSLTAEAFCFITHLAALISAKSEKIQNKFLDTNLYEMVIILSHYFIQPNEISVGLKYEIRAYTSLFLTSLVLFNKQAKELMYHKDLQYSTTKTFIGSLSRHKDLDHTNQFYKAVSSSIIFLASLAEFIPFNYSFKLGRELDFAQFFHCNQCSNNVNIVEALQELFIVMCGGDLNEKLHLEIWPLESWLKTAKTLKNHYVIQKNMLIFLQLNVSYVYSIKTTTLLNEINISIQRAVQQFRDSLVILTEAIILIQLLAKHIPEFATLCVSKRSDLDIVIFETITQATSKDLVNIAVHAFHMLTKSNECKITMVKKAILLHNIELLQCLLTIGANIHDVSSSLFMKIIVQRPPEIGARMAQLLLIHGCIPTKNIVTQCIKLNNYDVLNLLMCIYGVTQSDYGAILKWENLRLKCVDLALLNQLYNGIPDDPGSIELQRLCCKIKFESRNRIKLQKIAEKNQDGAMKYRKRFVNVYSRSLTIDNEGIIFQEKLRNSITSLNQIKPETMANSLLSFEPISRSENPVIHHNNSSNFGPLQQTIATQGQPTLSARQRDREDPQYIPVYGELKEFCHLFQCGSNYSYNIIDPRCLLTKNDPDNHKNYQQGFLPSYFGTRHDMETYVKMTTNPPFMENFTSFSNSILGSKTSDTTSHLSSQSKVKKVTSLDISQNEIEHLDILSISQPTSFIKAFAINVGLLSHMFQSLRELTISRNYIKMLPDSMFENLPILEVCRLDGNLIEEFPWKFFCYSKLNLLDIGNNKISSIKLPRYDLLESLKQNSLDSLDKLILQDNKLENVDFPALALFKNLRYLNLKSTNICINENYWFILPNVKKIILSDNNLVGVNSEIFKECHKLETIDLSNDKLVPINDLFPIDISQFDNLTILDLSNNSLSCKQPYYIPREILKIPNLKNIRMSNNELFEFPRLHMWKSTQIEKMDFSGNLITTLDFKNAKSNFPELTDLNLSCNRLKKLPPEIKDFSKLTYLNISHNPSLSTLPPEIGSLRDKLNKLTLDGLKLRDLPSHLRQPNDTLLWKKILKYYHNKLKSSVPYNSLKLVVLGKKGRGKTSLLAALQNKNLHQMKASNNQKVGINTSLWKLQTKDKDNQNLVYKLTCWEFLNQEEFFSSYEWFLSQRALYLIVFNVMCDKEAEIDSLKPYLLALKSRAPNAPIVIVGTHFDRVNKENQQNQMNFYHDYIKKKLYPNHFPKIKHMHTVDARRENQSINSLKLNIIDILQKHEVRGERLMGEMQPASFIRLEEILQTASENVLPQYPILNEEQIRSLVIKPGFISDEDEFHEAVDFLNKCGKIVYFRERNMGLHNLYFISPQWLCEMIAKVVSMNSCSSPGVIKLSDIMDLLQNQSYRTESRPLPHNVAIEKFAKQCLVILEKFDVVFQRNDNEILIPSRLHDAKPTLPNYLAREDKLRRFIEFSFLPAGFWPRLLTRICALEKSFESQHKTVIYDMVLWKKGIYMSFGDQKGTHSSSLSFSSSLVLEGKTEYGKEMIDLTVSRRSKLDIKIFVVIIDAIDVFVEEWYPGLTDRTVRGDYLMRTYAICPGCNENKFGMDQLLYEISKTSPNNSKELARRAEIRNASNSNNSNQNNNNNNNNKNSNSITVKCLICSVKKSESSQIPLIHLAPDLVLGDLPEELILDPCELEIETIPNQCLGYGGQGQVYKGRYKGQICAVKYFRHMTTNRLNTNLHVDPIDRCAYKQLRQEVNILRLERNHPSLLALWAADFEKLVLEYARLKDLNSVLQTHNLQKPLQQRIAYQVLEGLQFLHERSVLYRDLKPMNILMFDLSLQSAINAKLSDYGISRMMAPFGFINAAGTVGYQAPEVLDRLMTYGKSSDIFSFGITLFVMATRNHHPQELRQHWRPGVHKELISSFGINDWPRMQDAISKCLEIVPNDRPSIDTLIDHIICPSFVTVETVIPLTNGTRVQCSEAINCPNDGLEIVIVSGNELGQEIQCLNILTGRSKGKSFTKRFTITRVLSMTIEDDQAILGTESGQLFTYDFHTNDELGRIFQLPVSIISIAVMKPVSGNKIILIGLINGKLYYQIGFQSLSDLQVEQCNILEISPDPINNICVFEDRGFLTAGSVVYQIKYWLSRDIIEYTKVVDVNEKNQSLIHCFCLVHHPITLLPDDSNVISFYVTIKDEPLVYHYDDTGNLLKSPINCQELISNKIPQGNTVSSSYSYRVMSICAWKSSRYLAIGTASGHTIIVDNKLDLVTVLHLFKSPKLILQHINLSQETESDNSMHQEKPHKSWLIAIGNGYQSISTGYDGATLLIINDNVAKISREIQEHINKRKINLS